MDAASAVQAVAKVPAMLVPSAGVINVDSLKAFEEKVETASIETVNSLLVAANEKIKLIDAARVEDKAPHLNAGRVVDAAYSPALDWLGDLVKRCKRRVAEYIRIQQAEEAKRLEAAVAEQRKAQAALQKAMEKGKDTAKAEAKLQKAETALLVPVTEKVESFLGTTALRHKPYAKLVDIKLVPRDLLEAAVLRDLRDAKEAEEAGKGGGETTFTRMALDRINSGIILPGIVLDSKVSTVTRAAGAGSRRMFW